MKFTLYNFVAYQVAWFAVLIGAARGLAWAGAALALLVAVAHLALRRDPRELRLMGIAAAIGLLIDSTLALSGQVRFASAWPGDFAPYWMLSLWIVFATTLNHSLRWLMVRPLAAGIGGAVGGPLAYLAGERLGALDIATPISALPLIALLWTAAMVTLSMKGVRAHAPAATRSVPA